MTVGAFIWWYLSAAGGPRISWTALRAAHSCDDTLIPNALHSCAIFRDLRPSTVSMSVLVIVEMFNALNALSENRSLAAVPPWRNLWLLAAIGVSVLLHLAILCAPIPCLVYVNMLTAPCSVLIQCCFVADVVT